MEAGPLRGGGGEGRRENRAGGGGEGISRAPLLFLYPTIDRASAAGPFPPLPCPRHRSPVAPAMKSVQLGAPTCGAGSSSCTSCARTSFACATRKGIVWAGAPEGDRHDLDQGEGDAKGSPHQDHARLATPRAAALLMIDVLPEELVAHILHFLGPDDLLASAAVCRQWRRLADSSPKWRSLALHRWHASTCDIGNYGGSWKALYLDRNKCGRMGAFRWEITGFRRKRAREKITSPCFQVGGCMWRLECYPGGLLVDQLGGTLSLFLRHIDDPAPEMDAEDSGGGQPSDSDILHSHQPPETNLAGLEDEFETESDERQDGSARTRSRSHCSKDNGDWTRIVAFNIFIVNSVNKRLTIGKRSINEFRKNEEWGWGDFVGMSKLDDPGFVVSNRSLDDTMAEEEREKAAALEDIKEFPPDEPGTLTIEAFVVVSDPLEDKVTVEEMLRTFISGVFSNNHALQGVCLGKMDELLQMHSSPTSILSGDTHQHEEEGKMMMLDPCPNAKLRAILRQRGCVEKILCLLKDSSQDIELRVSAAAILQTLAFNDYNDDKAIIDAGGVPVLLAALAPDIKSEKKRTRVDLQVCAAGTLLNLQLCKESSHIVLKEGGVAICIELLRTQTDIDLLQEVAGVIANAAVCEEEGAVIVSRLGGIAPLMKHLQPDDELDEQYLDSDAPNRYTNVYPRPNETLAMDPTVLQLNSAIALQFAIRNSPAEFGAKDASAYISVLKKMWKHASIVKKCCAGIILVELSFFQSPGIKFVTKREITWLLGLINSEDIDEGVLLGVLKLIGSLCETNFGKARKWIRASDGVVALLKLICATDSQNAQWFAAHTLNGLSLFDFSGAKRIAECSAVELPETAADVLLPEARDSKEKRTLSSLEIFIRLLKSNNGGPRVAACDAIGNLVLNYPPCRDTLRGLGLIALVRDIMESSTHATLQFIAASTLACLIGSRASVVTLSSTHSLTFPSSSYLSPAGSSSFSLPFSFFLSPKESALSLSSPPHSSPFSSPPVSSSAPTSPKSRSSIAAIDEEGASESSDGTKNRRLASFFSSPSLFPVARPRSLNSIFNEKDERLRDQITPEEHDGVGLSSSGSCAPIRRPVDHIDRISYAHNPPLQQAKDDSGSKKGKEISADNGNISHTTASAREKPKYQLHFRRGTLYTRELELMRGKKGLRGMLQELVNTKNREVQFQAIKGIGTLGSMDDECLDFILGEDDGRAILHLGQFLECPNFMLLRVAAFSLHCLCSTPKAREVSHLIFRYQLVPRLKRVASSARDAAARALAKKTLKTVKKHKRTHR